MDNMQPVMYESEKGDKTWWLDHARHREDGPACEYACGFKTWYIHGRRHRIDGPAIEWADGRTEWWMNGLPLTLNDWLAHNKTLTAEEKIMLKLQYG
jgi:hypothetical protein